MRPLVSVLLGLALTGCGGALSMSSPLMMTCDVRGDANAAARGQCQEWRGDPRASANAELDFDTACASILGGTLINGACPAAFVGGCDVRPPGGERAVLHYCYAPDWNRTNAENDCAAMRRREMSAE